MRTIIEEIQEWLLFFCLRLTLDLMVVISRNLRFDEAEQTALIRRLKARLDSEAALH